MISLGKIRKHLLQTLVNRVNETVNNFWNTESRLNMICEVMRDSPFFLFVFHLITQLSIVYFELLENVNFTVKLFLIDAPKLF